MPNCRPLVLLLAALLVAPAAYAKGEKNKRVVVKKGESKAEAAPGGGGNTSADNRQGKIATVAVDVIGFTMMPTFGARGEFFLGADNTIALVATTGSTKFGNFEADKKLIEARFKHFFTNSFYMDGGLGVELDREIDRELGAEPIVAKASK